MNVIFERLRTILERDYQVDPAALTLESPLDGLGIDSLGTAELLFTVEDEFRIKLSPEPEHLATVGDVVAYIEGLVDRQHGAEGSAGAEVAPALGP